jgi:hypothetical protein
MKQIKIALHWVKGTNWRGLCGDQEHSWKTNQRALILAITTSQSSF